MQAAMDEDMRRTLRSRDMLARNPNLLLWYERLFDAMLGETLLRPGSRILEIGSGASPLKQLAPAVITSDVMPLPYLDHVVDCHRLREYAGIEDGSLDAIVLSNVLHHLRDPLQFLDGASAKLRPGGQMIMTEPYFSWLSLPIYKLLHPEPVDFSVSEPLLDVGNGPLSSSNQAIPHMIFFSRPDWRARLERAYEPAATRIDHFSSLSYMMTGGISRRLPVPQALYRALFPFDGWVARKAPRAFASFFIVRLTTRSPSCA